MQTIKKQFKTQFFYWDYFTFTRGTSIPKTLAKKFDLDAMLGLQQLTELHSHVSFSLSARLRRAPTSPLMILTTDLRYLKNALKSANFLPKSANFPRDHPTTP